MRMFHYLWPIFPAFPWKNTTVGALLATGSSCRMKYKWIKVPSKLLMKIFSNGNHIDEGV